MALVVFSYNSPFADNLKEPTRLFSFQDKSSEGKDSTVHLVIEQQWCEGGQGGTDIGFGASVYDASFLLSYYMNHYNNSSVFGKRVCEIGCGPGLCSLVASLSGATQVIATDGDAISVELTRKNVESNGSKLPGDIEAMKLYWGNEEDLQAVKSRIVPTLSSDEDPENMTNSRISGCYDVIIASDVAALPYAESYASLVKTMYDLTTSPCISNGRIPTGVVYLCSKLRHFSETDSFLPLFKNYFYVTKLPEEESIHPDFRADSNLNSATEQYDIFRAVPKERNKVSS